VAWFYRVLRNAVVDHYRRGGASEGALAALTRQLDEEVEPSLDDRDAVCGCVARVSGTRGRSTRRRCDASIDISVQDYAAEAGSTPNNSGVRVFRARETLRKRVVHWCGSCASRGCLDCSCGEHGLHARRSVGTAGEPAPTKPHARARAARG
jgi:hypothetical protein